MKFVVVHHSFSRKLGQPLLNFNYAEAELRAMVYCMVLANNDSVSRSQVGMTDREVFDFMYGGAR